MKTYLAMLVVAALWAIPAASAIAQEQEEVRRPVQMSDLPSAAQAAVQKEVGSQPIDSIRQDGTGDKATYYTRFKVKGWFKAVTVDKDGQVVRRAEDLDPALLPAAVKAQIEAGSKIEEASKSEKHGQVFYNAETKIHGRSKEYLFDGTGQIIGLEEELDPKSVPAEVQQAVQRVLTEGGQLLATERVTHPKVNLIYYVATVRRNGKTTEIRFTADGQPLKRG